MSGEANIFINTLLGVFKKAESGLSEQDMEKKGVENAMKELKEFLGPVARKHLGIDKSLSQILRWQIFPNPSTYGNAVA